MPINRVARRARRLIYAAACGLLAIPLLGVALRLEEWHGALPALYRSFQQSLSDGGTLLVAVPAVAFAGMAILLRRSRRLASGEAQRLARGHLWITLVAVLYGLGTALVGWQQASSVRHDFEEERLAQQIAIARLKARQIDDWAHERTMNLKFLASSLRTMPLEAVADSPPMHQLVELTLAQFLSSNPERLAAGLFLPDGTPVVTAGSFDVAPAAGLAQQVRAAAGRRGVSIGPVWPAGASPGGLSLAVLDPIEVAAPGKAPTRLVIVSLIDPTLGILKGFGDWPTASQSSEVELLQRDGDEVVHIVAGKDLPTAPPLSLRNPVINDQLVGARAVKTGHGTWDALDHHGHRVLAASYHATALPWIVIAKTDYREAMRPAEAEADKIWAMVWALVLFGGLFALALGAQLTMADALSHGQDAGD